MASLTQASIGSRRIIRFTIFGIIGFTIFRSLFWFGVGVYRHYFPAPPPPPKVEFGKLPSLPFLDKPFPEAATFTLQTPQGGFPTFDYLADVYYMPTVNTGLLSLDTARNTASTLGFSSAGEKVTDTIYRFLNTQSVASIQISIATGVFSISYNLAADPSPLSVRPLVGDAAVAKVKSLLSGADLLADDLSGEVKTEYVKLVNDKIVGAASLSDANFTKVNLYRKSYSDLPPINPDSSAANVWFIVSGEGQKEKSIIAGEYHYFPVDETKSSTYPVKTAQQAWNDLTEKRANILSLGTNPEATNIIIRKIYLAYYDSGVAMDFYQPVVVFEGDNGFVAVTPAVTGDYYQQ